MKTKSTQEIRDDVYARKYGHERRSEWYPHQRFCTPKRKTIEKKDDEGEKETTVAKTRLSFEDIWEKSAKNAELLKEINKAYV